MAKRIPLALLVTLGVALAIPGVTRVFAHGGRAPETHVVVIEGMKFTPATLEIRAGDRVTFKNSDLVPHTATTKPNQSGHFDSGNLKPGDSWTVTPQQGDPIHYACLYHVTMEGVIIVKP